MTEPKNALVTGATSGIGMATVRALHDAGFSVLAVGRRQDRLEELAHETGCKWAALDVRDVDGLTKVIADFAPDVLVNNAGVGHGITGFEALEPHLIQESFDINVVAPIQMSSVALAGMRARGRGHIVNIGSIAGLHTLVSAIYGGTKGAMHIFSQNLRFELRGSGIRVTEICPGRVESEFYAVAAGDREKLGKMGNAGIHSLQPQDIAAAIMFAVQAPPHVNVSMIEVLPTEQAVGGVDMTPVSKPQ